MKKADFIGMTDETLLVHMREGAEDISGYLIDKYKGTVRYFANQYYLIGADKEDLIQEGMIGLFKAIRDYRPGKNSSFYSFAVLCIKREMFTAINKYHSKRNGPLNNYISFSETLEENNGDKENPGTVLDLLESESTFTPEQVALDNEFMESFEEITSEYLSEKEYQVMQLFLQGKGYREIAKELSMTPKSADNALQRSKQKLGKLLRLEKEKDEEK